MPVTGTGTAQTGLGGPAGYGEIEVPRSDDGSLALDLSALFPDGLNYFGVLYDASAVYVNTNGTLSFLSALPDYPTSDNSFPGRDVIAPFWGDVDTRLDGEGAESGPVWADIDPDAGVFSVTWQEVGVYRRNAGVSNTFQLQLMDRGGGNVDIVFRYEQIGWTLGSGLTDAGARAGLASSRLTAPLWLEGPLGDLPVTLGNTGVDGLWLFEMRQGQVGDTVPISGIAMRGGTQGDLLYGGEDADFLNGGFGHDRLNGGAGADRFFHQGVAGHGSDWIQEYSAAEGDVLVFGGVAGVDDFQINIAETAHAGQAGLAEAFVIYRPDGQILWALVDGAAQDRITVMIAGAGYDLLA